MFSDRGSLQYRDIYCPEPQARRNHTAALFLSGAGLISRQRFFIPGRELRRTGLLPLWSPAESPVSYLNLKQLRKLLSEAGRKNMLDFRCDGWKKPICSSCSSTRSFRVEVWSWNTIRTHLTHNVLLQMFFSSVAEYYSDVHTVCWQRLQSDVEIRGGLNWLWAECWSCFSLYFFFDWSQMTQFLPENY